MKFLGLLLAVCMTVGVAPSSLFMNNEPDSTATVEFLAVPWNIVKSEEDFYIISETVDENNPSVDNEPVEPEPEYTIEDMKAKLYTNASVYVRSGPGTDYSKLGGFSKLREVEVTGITSNGWYRVKFGRETGYVFGQYMQEADFIVEDASLTMYTTGSVYVRSGPGTDYSKIGGVSCWRSVKITGISSNGWYRVNFSGKVGYISGDYLMKENPFEIYHYPLTTAERKLVCEIVMAEAGGESLKGQMAVAQCILNGCQYEDMRPEELVVEYKYTKTRKSPSQSVKDAVSAVFDDGKMAVNERILYFYAPDRVTPTFHLTQEFVIEIGGHKFYDAK